MTIPGARPRSRNRFALVLVAGLLGLLAAACQTASTGEPPTSFVPPPRTIDDVTRVLEKDETIDPGGARVLADQVPPQGADLSTLAEFYFTRGVAAGTIGRAKQEIDDLTKASEYVRQTMSPDYSFVYRLALAEGAGGNTFRHIQYLRRSVDAVLNTQNMHNWKLINPNALLAMAYAEIGDLRAAEAALAEAWRQIDDQSSPVGRDKSLPTAARAVLLDTAGNHAEAEAVIRELIALSTRITWLDRQHAFLARTLIRQGRLQEAENEARKAALGALAMRGRHSPHTAWMLRSLVWVLLEQGRYHEAETLARVVIDIYERTGTAADSLRFATARTDLARALEGQDRNDESLREYELIRAGLDRDRKSLEIFFARYTGYAELLLKTGDADRALESLGIALERSKGLVGDAHRDTAEIRGFLAQAYAAKGDTRQALREFREATPVLLASRADVDEETARPIAADRRLVGILTSYIRLLSEVKGASFEHEAGIDAAAEAFRLADVARGRSVQRALGASAARAAARSPELADVVRARQDAKKQITGLYADMGSALSQPGLGPDSQVVTALRVRVEDLRRRIQSLNARIQAEFPAYAELIDPKPVTLDQARAKLRPGEALITTMVGQDRTFVWAVPEQGPVAFAAVPIGAREMERIVTTLRGALEPKAETLGDIPDFDLALAHRLFSVLLEPVRSGWQDAQSLLVVAHGPLGQLPLALLPTKPVKLLPQSGTIFSDYREVPWLVRSHAVTMLPSVGSLVSLRSQPPGDPSRRAFVGFGDPYFSVEQATAAAREQTLAVATDSGPRGQSRPADLVAFTTRSVPITFRSSPQAFDSAQLAKLPRLPDTADEIRGLAAATNADPSRDVFLGARANEKTVKTLDLARYSAIAFATHGLVPGDLGGLTQPALALSAPQVAGAGGDGLLTMDEIMSLRLNADWIVLSACNTASGQGKGAEAVSGLGRAFFYAGARALLVSNWPVETTSARALTTDLFRRQQQTPGVTRAQALQQTLNWLIDKGEYADAESGRVVFSYAHPIFWAPFTLIGDGG